MKWEIAMKKKKCARSFSHIIKYNKNTSYEIEKN